MPETGPEHVTSRRLGIERQIERFIFEELLEAAPGGGDPLAAGAVDSLGIEELARHIECELGVSIDEGEMTRENFESIAALTALVDSKLGPAQP